MNSLSTLSMMFGITLVIGGIYWVRYIKNMGFETSDADIGGEFEGPVQNRSHLWAYSMVTLGLAVIQYSLL
jgi:hypothetical protein